MQFWKQAFYITGARCWMDNIVFFLSKVWDQPHDERTRRKQPSQDENRSFQLTLIETSFILLFGKKSKFQEKIWPYVQTRKTKSEKTSKTSWQQNVSPVFIWKACESNYGKHGRWVKAVLGKGKRRALIETVHLSANGSPSAGVLHQDRTYPVNIYWEK